MSFTQLPNELLSRILNHRDIELQKRIQLRAVSHCWKDIIETALMTITKVTLYDSADDVHLPLEPATIICQPKHFKVPFFRLLVRLFPKLTQLTVSLEADESYLKLVELRQILPKKTVVFVE